MAKFIIEKSAWHELLFVKLIVVEAVRWAAVSQLKQVEMAEFRYAFATNFGGINFGMSTA